MTGKPSIMCSELKTFETVLWINGHDHLGSHPCLTFYMSYFFVCIRAMVFLYRDVFETSTSASLHNVCFCYCCENTLKMVYVFSQSRNRASMDNATTFVHSVKEKIWKYLLLSFFKQMRMTHVLIHCYLEVCSSS